MSKDNIRPITMEHIQRYGDIYAKYGFKKETEIILMGAEL